MEIQHAIQELDSAGEIYGVHNIIFLTNVIVLTMFFESHYTLLYISGNKFHPSHNM
jgi:hypothetical protein